MGALKTAPPRPIQAGEIVTYGGIIISPLDPDPDLIDVLDIAHALSNSCRFTGHVRYFYSVAQHSVHVSSLLPAEYKKWGLLHDASEAYLSDLARPIKKMPGLGDIYQECEANLMEVIAAKYGLEWPMPEIVSEVDNLLLRMEQRDLMPYTSEIPGPDLPDWNIVAMSPEAAKFLFLEAVDALGVE